MNETKIEWCDSTWNPVTGCLHGCGYCYARGIAHRFAGFEPRCGGEEIPFEKRKYGNNSIWNDTHGETLHVFSRQPMKMMPNNTFRKAPYPYDFDPTFHRYRLNDYINKKPKNIFVCSMADLFGDWVPDEWIIDVFNACHAAPQHNYLFLTKNPARFQSLALLPLSTGPENLWFGFSTTNQQQLNDSAPGARWLPQSTFISLEPLHGPIDLTRIFPTGVDAYLDFTTGDQYWFMGGDENGKRLKWVIVGAETGNRKNKIIPKREWIEKIVNDCARRNIPVFMKNSLIPIMGEENMLRELPEGLRKGE